MYPRHHHHSLAVAGLRVALIVGFVIASPLISWAGDFPAKRFEIQAGDARTTLRTFSSQSGEQLVYPVDRVRGIRTNPVHGELPAREALDRMLAGTGLAIMEDKGTRALVVFRTEPEPPPPLPRPKPRRRPTPDPDSPVRLDLFEVTADPDEGYGVLESNALTAFSLDLTKMPATVQVFTRSLADDVGATSIEDLLIGYSGTVTAASDNPGSQIDMPGDRNGNQGLSLRGVSAGEIKRDGFIGPPNGLRTAGGYTDNFSTERVEVIEGPQSLLYGSVGGGGVINAVSKRAQFDESRGSITFSVDRFGSRRALVDYNEGGERFASRFVGVAGREQLSRDRLGSASMGFYGQIGLRIGQSTTLRLSTEKIDHFARVSFRPKLNPFLAPDDPRRDQDARYLVLTGQLADLDIIDGGLNYDNLESLASWWSSEHIKTHWSSLTLESRLSREFSAQFTAIYSETNDLRVVDGRTLLPARGLSGSEENPFDVTAVRIGSPTKINEQRDRNKGAKVVVVHETDFQLGPLDADSFTAFGGQVFHRGPSFGSSGIAKAYYQADADWNPIIDPALTVDYGRVPLRYAYFPVENGVPARPLFRPGTSRVTLDGQNYVLLPRIARDPARASPTNPYGLIPNNPTAVTPDGYIDWWNRGGETHSGSVFLANFSEWNEGKLATLAGYSLTRFETINVSPGAVTRIPKDVHAGWQIGASYRITPWLRSYASLGTAERAEASTTDIYGVALKSPKAASTVPELGLKATLPDERFSAQISISPETRALNENHNTGDTSFRDAINPDGINGRLGGADANQRVNLNRTHKAASIVVTARPMRDWHLRILAAHLDGEVSESVSYRQLYNDQFHVSGGVVTYTDGTPVLIDPAGGAGAAVAPLTLAMINSPGNPYFAAPDRTSGTITNPLLRAVLTTPDPVRGKAATGAVGLPLSMAQYDFSSPYPDDVVTIYRAGEKNTGFNEYTFNLQSRFEFSSGRLRGFGLLCDVQAYTRNRAYYVNYPGADGGTLGTQVERRLFRLPDSAILNIGLSYRRKLSDTLVWSTQLNVRNVLNDHQVWVIPSPVNGTVLNARLSAQPRQWIWTNTISF